MRKSNIWDGSKNDLIRIVFADIRKHRISSGTDIASHNIQ